MDRRLLFITPGLGKGGAETQLLKIAKHAQSEGDKVMILALKPINNFSENLEDLGIRVVFLKDWTRNSTSNFVSLYRYLKEFKPDIVVAFMFIAIIIARILKLKFRFKLISSVRNSAISKKWSSIFKLTSNLDDLVVFNAIASQHNFENTKLTTSRSIVINNAVSIPPAEISEGLADGEFVWISIAHFRPSKDYHTLFEAVSLIKDQDFRIDILGNLNNQTWPQEKIKELQIENRVRLLGFQQHPHLFLKKADALVLSSFNEGMPNAILEAMSYSKPIVASNIDGIRELLTDSNCGFLFEPGNARELADRMTEIMHMSVDERKSLGSKGRQKIEDSFSERVVLEKWQEVINEI